MCVFGCSANVQLVNGVRGTYRGTIPPLHLLALIDTHLALQKADALAAAIDQDEPWTSRDAARLDGQTAESLCNELFWTESAANLFKIGLRTVFCAEPQELSALFALHGAKCAGGWMPLFDTEGGAQEFKFVGGTQQFSERLAEQIAESPHGSVQTDAVVEHIEHSATGAVVHMRDGSQVAARHVVIAMPPRLAGLIRYSPLLPTDRDELCSRMPLGSIIKTVMFYDRPHWEAAGLSGAIVSDVGPISASYAEPQYGDRPCFAIMGFLLAKHSREWRQKTLDERRDAIAQQYATMFGIAEMRDPVAYDEHDWNAEEFSRGCYTGVCPPGVLTQMGKALKEPCGVLHFAGTESSNSWPGYLEGAICSGERAADEILSIICSDFA